MTIIKRAFILLVLIMTAGNGMLMPPIPKLHAAPAYHDIRESWIIEWNRQPDQAFLDSSEQLSTYRNGRLIVARPKPGVEPDIWLQTWSSSSGVALIEPNQKTQMLKLPDDPLQSNQSYLSIIHASEAWDQVTENKQITIAVVDTGIDFSHQDLKDNIIDGYNLINPNEPPIDDNDHGTNVAGIIAAVGNNDKGITGLLWKTNIMPIKALDSDGNGDEDKLGEGIRYAVDHGAKIVVLSLGLNKYSAYMSAIVQYAEEKGVLLVAAAGNEGKAVKYPAAYPTVLAVGGASLDGRPEDRSNYGPELDILAPWDVFTTGIGGRYEYKNGTSLAAPQVAAVCAMIWAKHPGYSPAEVRNQIRQTADAIAQAGWDERSGFGLLRADRAVSEAYKTDMFENNDQLEDAKPIPLLKTISASFQTDNDSDWYRINAPYNGTLQFRLSAPDLPGRVSVSVEGEDGNSQYLTLEGNDRLTTSVPVAKGTSYIQLLPEPGTFDHEVLYQFTAEFTIYPDSFEDNDKQFKASVLPSRSTRIIGTFDHMRDVDWYLFPVPNEGTLRVKAYVDTNRMDPVLVVQRKGQKEIVFDQKGDGGTEETFLMDVQPGDYYIKMSNIADYAYPVVGEYILQIDYRSSASDPHEPNDKPYQATVMSLGTPYEGVLESNLDNDWFRFKINSPSWVIVSGVSLGDAGSMKLSLQTQGLQIIEEHAGNNGSIDLEKELKAGTYYVRVTGSGLTEPLPFTLQVSEEPLVSGYRDISGHWAQSYIEKLTGEGVFEGYENRRFQPDYLLTRAETAVLLSRAFHLQEATAEPTYRDVIDQFWAYDAIARVTEANLMDGYADGSFRSSRPVNRAEMAAIISRALGLKGNSVGGPTFTDTPSTAWYAPYVRELEQEGLISGYPDGSYHPNRGMTRAEFAVLLSHTLERTKP